MVASRPTATPHMRQSASNVSCGEASPAVLKTGAALFAIALVSRVVGTTGFFFLLFVAAFSLPKGYELKQKEVALNINIDDRQ